MASKLISLHGIELDRACATALGWTIHKTANPQDAFYITEGKPVLVDFWKPTQSARQCMRLMLDHGIGTQYIATSGIWSATIETDSVQCEAKAKRLHEAVCRCFLLNQVAKGRVEEMTILKDLTTPRFAHTL